MATSLFTQKILKKIFGTKYKHPVKLNMNCSFELVNATLNVRATQNNGQI